MKCGNCNTELNEASKFCHNCGSKVDGNYKSNDIDYSNEISDIWFGNDKSKYTRIDNLDFKQIGYKDEIYFLADDKNEIWKENIESGSRNLLAIRDDNDNNKYIAVNRRGIFTYDDTRNKDLYMYDFEGKLIGHYFFDLDSFHDLISNVFILDNKILYTTSNIYEDYGYEVKLMEIENGIASSELIYETNPGRDEDILKLIMGKDYIFIYMSYKSDIYKTNGADIYTRGWFKYDLINKSITYYDRPAHRIMIKPMEFVKTSEQYIPDETYFDVLAFDLQKDIVITNLRNIEAEELKIDIDSLVFRDLVTRIVDRDKLANLNIGDNSIILDNLIFVKDSSGILSRQKIDTNEAASKKRIVIEDCKDFQEIGNNTILVFTKEGISYLYREDRDLQSKDMKEFSRLVDNK